MNFRVYNFIFEKNISFTYLYVKKSQNATLLFDFIANQSQNLGIMYKKD